MGLVAAGLRDLAERIRRMDRRSRAIAAAAVAVGALVLALLLPGALNPPRAIAVADLAGKDLGTARELVRQAGGALRVAEAASDTVPKGQILHQEPPPNTQFMSNRPLTVVVSSGPPPVKVPDLRNRRVEDARKDLEAAGLSLGKMTERQTTRQPWGAVLGQSARAGSTLPPGTVVDVVVSAPPYTTVPGLGGKAIGDAEAELQRLGLRLGDVRQDAVAGRRAGTVTGQEPAAGVRLRQGDAVAITIAVPPAAPAAPKP
jgi:serine/threonine-protein kinase